MIPFQCRKFIPSLHIIMHWKAVVFKNGAPLCKCIVPKTDWRPLIQQSTQDMQKALYTCSNHNLRRSAHHVAAFCHIAAKRCAEIGLALRLALGE